MDGKSEHSLAPEWLSFNRELPISSQESKGSRERSNSERDRHNRRFGKQNSYHHPNHVSPSPSHPSNYNMSPSASPNWRHSESNPRILNRSKSSPVFESEEKDHPAEPPLIPADRPNLSPSSSDRNFPVIGRPSKSKLKGKPPALTASRSQPNFFSSEKLNSWQHQKLTTTRSPPASRSNSYLSMSTTSTTLLPQGPTTTPSSMAAAVAANPSTPITTSSIADDIDLEMEKLRVLVPSPSVVTVPKPPRLVGGRKLSKVSISTERSKKPVTPTSFRKASSESSLAAAAGMSNEELLARKLRTVAKAAEKEKAKVSLVLKETVEEKDKVVGPRSNFFMDVIKREKKFQDDAEELDGSASLGEDDDKVEGVVGGEDVQIMDRSATPPASATVEDEEKFLRLLGWVPDEEDHVEELKEDEIAEVRLKLGGQQSHGSPLRRGYTGFECSRGTTVPVHQD